MILIIASQFDKPEKGVVKELEVSAIEVLEKAGEKYEVIHVPGAIEIPIAAQKFIRAKKPDAVIALGCVTKGETGHYDLVLRSCIDGLTRVALDESVPIIQGVLACPTPEIAATRQHLGKQFAETALKMKNLLNK